MNSLPCAPSKNLARKSVRSIARQICLIFLILTPLTVLTAAGLAKPQNRKRIVTAEILFPSVASLPKRHLVRQQEAAPNVLPPIEAERIIARRAREVLLALKAGDIARFATFIHPQKGVRFSPYASVLPDEDRVVKRNQLAQMWASKARYKWGTYDGSGDTIRLTFRKYHRRFIFDHDFSRAKEVRYNGEIMGHGTTINNIREFYPNAITVEHFFPGFDPKVSGMDWTSLWLVFEKRGNEWFLVGVVHNEWTI